MQMLKEDLFEKVRIVLDNNPSATQPILKHALAGRWEEVLQKAARFWARAGSEGSSKRDDLQAPLQDLHLDIHQTIDAEVCAWTIPVAKAGLADVNCLLLCTMTKCSSIEAILLPRPWVTSSCPHRQNLLCRCESSGTRLKLQRTSGSRPCSEFSTGSSSASLAAWRPLLGTYWTCSWSLLLCIWTRHLLSNSMQTCKNSSVQVAF